MTCTKSLCFKLFQILCLLNFTFYIFFLESTEPEHRNYLVYDVVPIAFLDHIVDLPSSPFLEVSNIFHGCGSKPKLLESLFGKLPQLCWLKMIFIAFIAERSRLATRGVWTKKTWRLGGHLIGSRCS